MARSFTLYTEEALKPVVATSFSYAEVIRKFGRTVSGGLHAYLKRRISNLGIDTSHFLGKASTRGRVSKLKKHWSKVLVLRKSGSRTSTEKLRRALLESGRPYECEKCGIYTWNDGPLSLQVDHKNRIWLDDRPENVGFKCPNCHSQTIGWCGRKDGGRHPFSRNAKCDSCGRPRKGSRNGRCHSCAQKERTAGRTRKVAIRPDLETLLRETKEEGFKAIGRKYGVSDNAVRKWIRYHKERRRI
jgi:predicted RNA-binding Zn-ribbon protein involved in translation (DUF1610 family)